MLLVVIQPNKFYIEIKLEKKIKSKKRAQPLDKPYYW